MSKYNFDVKLHQGKFTIEVDTNAKYGYFEHDDLGDEFGGGLWFISAADPKDNRLELMDADGTPELPKDVINALRYADFIVPGEFE